jgi:hypothetical protein
MFSTPIAFFAALLAGTLGFGITDTGADGVFQIACFALLGYTGLRLLLRPARKAQMVNPPSMTWTAPVVNAASSEAR